MQNIEGFGEVVDNTALVVEDNSWDYIEGYQEYYKQEVIVVGHEIARKGKNLQVWNRRFSEDQDYYIEFFDQKECL